MVKEKGEIAYSIDLDDTIFDRGLPLRLLTLPKILLVRIRYKEKSVKELPIIERGCDENTIKPFNVKEWSSYYFHKKRNLIPGIKEVLEDAVDKGIPLYGNTGRSNKSIWVEMTKKRLDEVGCGHLFEQVFHTPKGVPTGLSKATAIAELFTRYLKVVHFDDDPKTAVLLALLFPNLQVNLINYTITRNYVPEQVISSLNNIQIIDRNWQPHTMTRGVIENLLFTKLPQLPLILKKRSATIAS